MRPHRLPYGGFRIGSKLRDVLDAEAALFAAKADAAHLPYLTGYFDFAMMVEVCSHIVNLDAALGEAVRVIVPGGSLVISDGSNALNPLYARRRRRIWEEKEGLRPPRRSLLSPTAP